MAHECQNPVVPHSGGQQFTSALAQGFSEYTSMFVPVQYHVSVPLVMQPVMLGSMSLFSQNSGLPRSPMLTKGSLAGNSMAQGSVATPRRLRDNHEQPRCR